MIRHALKIINPNMITKGLINQKRSIVQKRIINYRNLSTSIVKSNKEYTKTGEWYLKENDYFKVGLSDNSATELGELVYIEFDKEVGESVDGGEEIIMVESVKASASVYAPFDCEILENNDNIIDNLELITENAECENTAWLVKIKKI